MSFTNLRAEVKKAGQPDREAQIATHLPQVQAIARRVRMRVPPSVTLDDLITAGTLGLIQAVDRFDPTCRARFSSYAQHRIHGAMLDFLRSEDPLSRVERRRIRQIDSVGGPVTVSIDQMPSDHLRSNTHADLQTLATVTLWDAARRCLSGRENRVLKMIYLLGRSNREVAIEIGVNESRVSQLKSRAISKLRHYLTDKGRGAA